jgi:hypothetical protein
MNTWPEGTASCLSVALRRSLIRVSSSAERMRHLRERRAAALVPIDGEPPRPADELLASAGLGLRGYRLEVAGYGRLPGAKGTANAVRVRALPGFKFPSLRRPQALSLHVRGEGLMHHRAKGRNVGRRWRWHGVGFAHTADEFRLAASFACWERPLPRLRGPEMS